MSSLQTASLLILYSSERYVQYYILVMQRTSPNLELLAPWGRVNSCHFHLPHLGDKTLILTDSHPLCPRTFIMFVAPDLLCPLALAQIPIDRWMFSKALLYFWSLRNPVGNEGVTMDILWIPKASAATLRNVPFTEPLGIA